jgi:hypothetical protein
MAVRAVVGEIDQRTFRFAVGESDGHVGGTGDGSLLEVDRERSFGEEALLPRGRLRRGNELDPGFEKCHSRLRRSVVGVADQFGDRQRVGIEQCRQHLVIGGRCLGGRCRSDEVGVDVDDPS